VQDLSALDWNEIVKTIQASATSGAGRMSIASMQPFSTALDAQKNIEKIFQVVRLLQIGARPFMESLDLYEPWHSRIRKSAVLKTLEIKDVRNFCFEILALREACTQALALESNPWCEEQLTLLMDPAEPISAIDQIITPRGEIRSDASETLYQLFREKENLSRQIEQSLDRAVRDHQLANLLQDKYVTTRDGRWVLPVKSGMQHYMPGVIHGSSQTKQTVFMEPESTIPLNNRLRQIEVEIDDEIERILTELSKYLHGLANPFANSRNLLEAADVKLSEAQMALRLDAKNFSFTENKLDLKEVRHPILILSGRPVVANSVSLDADKSILLLSGPNAGGKTVLLKSIGLAAQMARCGLPICAAEKSEIPFFDHVQIGIGDSQNVGEELSTFAAHLKILQAAAHLKGPQNLILLDEICGSTDPEEGSALARAFIERFSQNEVFAVITSHLGPLKAGWKKEDSVLNGSLEYDSRTSRPTYQFLQGIPGDSLAIQTAKRVGVDNEIVQRSLSLLSPETRTRLSGIEEIESLKADMNVLRDHLKKEQRAAEMQKQKYEKLQTEIVKEKENILAKALRQAEKKVDELIAQAKAEATFKKHTALQEIKFALPEVVKAKPAPGNQGPLTTADEFAKRFPPGTKIFVPTLNQDGLVQSLPNSKGEVQVLSNSLRLTLPWQELKPAQTAQNPTASLIRRSTGLTVALHDSEKVLDLRGQTVEEAISSLEIELDHSAVQKEERIKIIHGHGTDALKKAVRAYLSRSNYVKKWKAGSNEQGGDGVTWAEISND
jgi:DNA mismatch repair protein MutS2